MDGMANSWNSIGLGKLVGAALKYTNDLHSLLSHLTSQGGYYNIYRNMDKVT